MAKRRGTNSGRYRKTSMYTVDDARRAAKDRGLKKRNPEKYKRRKKIAKFSRDGKIDKKEGRKLAKRGISLQKVRNRNISEHRQAQRDAGRSSNNGRSGGGSKAPAFEPLKIKRGAERADFDRQMQDYERRTGKKSTTTRNNNKGNNNNNNSGPKIDNPYKDKADDMLDEIDKTLDPTGGDTEKDPIDMNKAPENLYDQSTRTDGMDLRIGPARDPSKKTGTQAFKRRKRNRAARRRRQQRINRSLNI